MRWEFVSEALSLFLPVSPCLFRLHSRILRFHPRPRYPQDSCGCKIRRNKHCALNLTFLLNSRIISKAAPLDLQWRHKWRTNDQPIKRGTDKPNDRSTDGRSNQRPDERTKYQQNRPDARTSNRATEQPSNRATEQPSNRATEQPSNRATDQTNYQTNERFISKQSVLTRFLMYPFYCNLFEPFCCLVDVSDLITTIFEMM